MFSCEFYETFHNNFFKEPFVRLLLHVSASHCPTTIIRFFQKRCHTCFPAEYFLDLIWRLATRKSSIFQKLCEKPIFNPINIYDGAFPRRKRHYICLTRFQIRLCKQPRKRVVEWKIKTWEVFITHLQILYTEHKFLRSVT